MKLVLSKEMVVVVAMGLCLPFIGSPVAFAQEDTSGACYISKDDPVALTVELGTKVGAQCQDGELVFFSESTDEVPAEVSEYGVQAMAQCHGRSQAIDNRAAQLVMTEYDVGFPWWYDGSAVYGWGPISYWENHVSVTGWYLNSIAGYLYNTPGWGEGWAEFGHGIYGTHEHHLIIAGTGWGGCTLSDYFWGTLPNWSYQVAWTYIS